MPGRPQGAEGDAEEVQHLLPGEHPDDVELDVEPPRADTRGATLRLDPQATTVDLTAGEVEPSAGWR